MSRRLMLAVVWVVPCFLLLASAPARADGLIIVTDGPVIPNHFAFAPLEVTYHHVTVDVDEQVATTSVDEEFYNASGRNLEGTYIFPLPVGGHIDKFSMDINGREAEAELLPADKAKSIYEEIVRKSRDPALLEYAGRDALKVRIFPIEPNSKKHIQLKYTQLLSTDGGLTEYVYPLNTEKFSSRPLDDVSITVNLKCGQPIKSLYCPSHNVTIHRDGERSATVIYHESNVRPDTDFKLVYSRGAGDVGVNLLTCKSPGEEGGYFMLLASPGLSSPKSVVQAKDICFVLDTSGSMAGPKIEQAKRALRFCLNNLNDGDGFDVVRFSTEAEPLFGKLKPAAKENVDAALNFVDGMKASGGTAIDDAIQRALAENSRGIEHPKEHPDEHSASSTSPADPASSHRPYLVVFLTDGMPTVGQTDEDTLVASATNGGSGVHIFCFGIGNDVNTHLLDRIAGGTRAASAYVGDNEDIEVKVSNLYNKIREPALTDVAVTFDGAAVRTSQMYPAELPDLFKGEMLVAFGKYSGNGAGVVKITGNLNGEHKEIVNDVKFTDTDTTRQYIPRLWATRRVGWLLDEIRLHGESSELKDEATQLARQWGIVTPYTAYLIMEDEQKRRVPIAMQSMRQMSDDKAASAVAGGYFKSIGAEAKDADQRSGARATDNSQRLSSITNGSNEQQAQQLDRLSVSGAVGGGGAGGGAGDGRHSETFDRFSAVGVANSPAAAATQPSGYRFATNYGQQVKVINGRSFYQNGDTWLDASAQSAQNLKQRRVKFNSDEYFALLSEHVEAAPWLALGSDMDVVIGDTLYSIRAD